MPDCSSRCYLVYDSGITAIIYLIAVAAAIWYMIAVMPDGTEKEGTLVEAIPGWEMMVS